MQNTVTEQTMLSDPLSPLVFEAHEDNFDFKAWVKNNYDYIHEKQLKHGSLIFRNFGTKNLEHFEAFTELLSPNLYKDYGDLPPRKETRTMYGATPYTPALTIFFHNEASHTPSWPLKQYFYCIKPAEEGGELRVVDGRTVLKALDPEIVREFASRRLVYIRNFIPYFDVSWQDFFKTNDKNELESICRQKGLEFEWKGDTFCTRQYAPAVTVHPKTQELLWFNQIQLHHPSMFDEKIYKSLKNLLGDEKEFPRNVLFGDGELIPEQTVKTISDVLDQEAFNIKATEGDIIFNDNMLVSHSRTPFKGDRDVCVALAESVSEADLKPVNLTSLETEAVV